MHRLVPCMTALLSAAVLAGCGGESADPAPGPTLPSGLASGLADRSDAIAEAYAAGEECDAAHQADALVNEVIAAVQAGRVPPAFQEPILATAQKLQNEINCAEAPAPPPEEEQQESGGDCEELEAQRDALEEEKKDEKGRGKAKGRDRRLDEEIAALEEQIAECEDGRAEDDGGDEG